MYGDDEHDQDSDYGGRYTPLSATSSAKDPYAYPYQQQPHQKDAYRISFRSVDDDELQRLMRTLVTPVPASTAADSHTQNTTHHPPPYYDSSSNSNHYIKNRNNNNNNNNSSTARRGPTAPYRDELQETLDGRSESPRRADSRSESVALFKQLNSGDDDNSLDLVKSDLHEWMDPNLLDILSRPSSRAPSTVSDPYHTQQQQQQQQQRRAPSPPLPSPVVIEPPAVLETPALRPKKVNTDAITTAAHGKGRYDRSIRRRSHALLNESAEKTRQLLDAVEQSFLAEEAQPPSPPPQPRRRPRKHPEMEEADEKAGLAKKPSRLDAILALRRDSDALLERRLSLLKKRADSLLGDSSGSDASGSATPAGRRRWSTYTGGEADLLPASASAASAASAAASLHHATFSPPSSSRRVRTISLPGTESGMAERLPSTASLSPLDAAFADDELLSAEESLPRVIDRLSLAPSSPRIAASRRLEPHYEDDPIDITPRMAPLHTSKLYAPSRRIHDEEKEWRPRPGTLRVQETSQHVLPEGRVVEDEHERTPKLLPKKHQSGSSSNTQRRRATLSTTEDKTLMLIPKRSYKDAPRKTHVDQEKPRLLAKRTLLANPSKEAIGSSPVDRHSHRRGPSEQDASPTLLPRRARRYTQGTTTSLPQPPPAAPSQRRRATVTQHYEGRGEDKSVAESAKDILASIRERRRRSTALDF